MLKEEVDRLYDATLPLAEHMLGEHGEFYPYAYWVRKDGTVEAVSVLLDEQLSSSREIIEFLTGAIRAMVAKGDIIAAAICYDVGIKPDGKMADAICMDIEHRENVSSRVLIPYSKGMFGRIRYGEAGAQQREPTMFALDT